MFRIIMFLCLLPILAHAQSPMDQINAVDQAHKSQRAAEILAEHKKAELKAIAEQKRQALATKKAAKEQDYQAQLRELELESKKMDVEQKRAITDRSNDYIDRDLAHQGAETGVLQATGGAITDFFSGAGKALSNFGGDSKE